MFVCPPATSLLGKIIKLLIGNAGQMAVGMETQRTERGRNSQTTGSLVGT